MNKSALKWITLVAALIAIIVLFFVFRANNIQGKCKNVKVNLLDTKDLFIDENDLKKFILSKENLIGQPISSINLLAIEDILLHHQYVQSADVYLGVSGTIQCNVKLEEARFRIFDGERSYYLSSTNRKLPLASNYSAQVPVVVGEVKMDSNVHKILYSFGRYVDRDLRLQGALQQIFVLQSTELGFVTSWSDHKILLGDTKNLAEKIDKLFTFYKDGLSKMGWEKHQQIDLRYKGQVICK